MKHLLAIVPALLLAACAGNPQPSASRTALAPSPDAEVSTTAPVYTGTRLTNRGTDRSVRSIGNAGAREDAQSWQSLGNSVGARSN